MDKNLKNTPTLHHSHSNPMSSSDGWLVPRFVHCRCLIIQFYFVVVYYLVMSTHTVWYADSLGFCLLSHSRCDLPRRLHIFWDITTTFVSVHHSQFYLQVQVYLQVQLYSMVWWWGRKEKSGADWPPYNVSHQLGLALSVISLFILSYIWFLFYLSLVATSWFLLMCLHIN